MFATLRVTAEILSTFTCTSRHLLRCQSPNFSRLIFSLPMPLLLHQSSQDPSPDPIVERARPEV